MIVFTLRIPDHYAECYPGMTEMDDAIDDSDEEADYSKMDLVRFEVINIIYSSLERRHYNLFHPLGLIRCLELSLFICLFTFGKFSNLLEPL